MQTDSFFLEFDFVENDKMFEFFWYLDFSKWAKNVNTRILILW